MNDPLDALRAPLRPVDPDPAFAARLRARVERAVLGPTGSPPTTWEEDMPTTATAAPAPAAELALHTLTPYLAVVDARDAVEFYVTAFDAARRGDPIVMPDGRIGHVELAFGDSVLMMADEYPEFGLLAPVTRGGATQSLHLEVADPDAVVARAVRLGATLERPVADAPYGRSGVVRDRSGHRWMVTRQPPTARPGDAVYASLLVPDAAAAERFYPAALGFSPNLGGGHDRPTMMLCYRVTDLDAAVARVRAAGGTATDPEDRPYGRVSDAVDDQGLPFALRQGPALPLDRPAAVELRHPDTARARAFYGTVLGWRLEPATRPGDWHAVDAHPPVLLTSPTPPTDPGSTAIAIPVFAVDDLDAAAVAVRAAGGTATRATTTTAYCTDDQDTPFALRH